MPVGWLSKRIKIGVLVILWIIVFILCGYLLLGKRGYFAYLKLGEKITDQEHANNQLAERNLELRKKLKYLKSDDYLEELAFTELGYQHPEDLVIRWKDPPDSFSQEKKVIVPLPVSTIERSSSD